MPHPIVVMQHIVEHAERVCDACLDVGLTLGLVVPHVVDGIQNLDRLGFLGLIWKGDIKSYFQFVSY